MVFIGRSEINRMQKNIIDKETGMTEFDLFESEHEYEDWHIIEDIKEKSTMECPEDRCPLCWYRGVDALKVDGGDYCEEHQEEMR